MESRTSGGVYNRRVGTISRLETQLKKGKKLQRRDPEDKYAIEFAEIDLSEHDIKRINKELHVLKERTK